jgi:Bacterial PH domain
MSSQPDEAAARAAGSAAAAGPAEPRFATPAGQPRAGGFGASAVSTAGKMPWKTTADGTTVFRRPAPLILFWLWVAFALFNLFDVGFRDHDYFSLELTAGLLAVTAVVYACALRPRVTADGDAIYVYNPYRDHVAPWGAVSGVYLGDSVELSCARPGPKRALTIYCWALYSGRRSRIRAQLRSERHQARVTGRTPPEIGQLRLPDAANLMAAELGRRSAAAQQRGVPEAVVVSRWAWLPVASLLAPAAALLALILAR